MKAKSILFIAAMLILGGACKKKGCTNPLAINYNSEAEKDDGSCEYAPTYTSQFEFVHELNGSSFLYDTILYVHPAGQDYSVQTLKYFISNLVLYKANGDSVYIDVAHYIDAQDASTTTLEYNESIENTAYTGIAFVFGLDDVKNATGAFVDPPESLMEWPVPMGGGYHYMKLEGKYDASGTTESYNVHTGKSMGNPYFFRVNLPQSFTVTDNKVHVELKMEINNWFQNPALFDFDVYGDAIMGNQTAQQVIMNNGVDVFSIGTIY